MSTTLQPRKPRGIPVGGQFDTKAHGESGVTLGNDQVASEDIQEDATERAFADAPSVFTTKFESLDDRIAAFNLELDRAVADLASDDNWRAWLDMQSQFHRYSFANTMLIHLQTGGRATRVAGFRAWQEKFNRTVNKGEKAIAIRAPKTVWVTKKDTNDNVVKGKDGKPVKEKRIVGFTLTSVFDVSQTSGDPLPEIERELSEDPPEGFVDDMVAAAEALGYTVEFREMNSHANGTAQGWTSPRDKQIVVDASQTPGSQAATLAHELGHVAAGHCDPENDGKYHVGEGGCRGRFEIEAESIAYAITRANGMSMDGSKLSAQYVAGWSKHDKDGLRESAETVAKATKKVLESGSFRNVED